MRTMRWRVFSLTSPYPLRARETVVIETPAAFATSWIVCIYVPATSPSVFTVFFQNVLDIHILYVQNVLDVKGYVDQTGEPGYFLNALLKQQIKLLSGPSLSTHKYIYLDLPQKKLQNNVPHCNFLSTLDTKILITLKVFFALTKVHIVK